MEAAELMEESVVTPRSPLEDFVEFESIDGLTDLENEEGLINEIESIQDYDKMYEFVNENVSHEKLQEYADKCLQYIVGDFGEYQTIARKTAELKSKNILVEDLELDFI